MDILNVIKNAIQGNMGGLTTKLKEKRFTSTARVLGEAKAIGVNVQIVNQPNGGAAWWNPLDKRIVLNDAMPATSDDKLKLIWERAKLFHELFHVLFTNAEAVRQAFHRKSNNGDRYLWVSNVLEDGRIEYHGGKLYAGTTWYIRTLLKHLVKSDSADSGLLIYVRIKLWRNKKEKAFWAKYIPLINEAITAKTSTRVWEIAHEIVQDMEKPQPPQPASKPPQGKPEKSDEESDDEGEGQPQPSDEDSDDDESDESGEGESMDDSSESEDDESDESGEGESMDDGSESEDGESGESGDDDESDEDADSESQDDAGEADDDSKGQSGGEGSDESGTGSEAQETPSAPPEGKQKIDDEIADAIEDLLEEAMEQIGDEVDAELIEIDNEAANYVAEQEYADSHEANIADQLTEIFASILVDSKRQRFQSCKHGGMLDTKRLLATQTGGEFMQERVERSSQPHIALVIDLSFSMDWQRTELTQAARILHGAIAASGAVGVTLTFGAYDTTHIDKVDCYSTIPTLFNSGFSTPTHAGLIAAREWLNNEQAKRGMVIVITDGEPNNPRIRTQTAFQNLSNDGFYVLNVLLGASDSMIKTAKTMCHDYACVKDATGLVRELEVPIGNFMSGRILMLITLHRFAAVQQMHTKNKTTKASGKPELPKLPTHTAPNEPWDEALETEANAGMSVNDAMTAVEYAEGIVSGCESIDELDEASDFDVAMTNCPDGFTWEQKKLAQMIILRAFEKSIGRA